MVGGGGAEEVSEQIIERHSSRRWQEIKTMRDHVTLGTQHSTINRTKEPKSNEKKGQPQREMETKRQHGTDMLDDACFVSDCQCTDGCKVGGAKGTPPPIPQKILGMPLLKSPNGKMKMTLI